MLAPLSTRVPPRGLAYDGDRARDERESAERRDEQLAHGEARRQLAVALLFSGWWWSLWAFRRYVREHFAASPPVFEGDPAMVRELGELFSIEPEANDTVESYAARVRAKVGIPERGGAHRLIPRPVRMNYDDQIEEAI